MLVVTCLFLYLCISPSSAMVATKESSTTSPPPTSVSPPVLPLSSASECHDGSLSSPQPPTDTLTVHISSPSPSLLRSSSLPLPTTAVNCLDGLVPCSVHDIALEISAAQFPLENNVKATMDKASVTVTTTLRTDTVPPSSSQMQLDTDREVNNKSLASSTTPDTDSVKFFPSLGSWAKPLYFKPPATPPEPSTPQGYDPAIVGNQLAAMWPTRSLQPPIEKLPPPELKDDGSLRFPWAARLSPQSRNLYRAATPTYRLDGTPERAKWHHQLLRALSVSSRHLEECCPSFFS